MEVGIYEAKTQFAKLVARAERGERIVILRHGKAVAELVPTAQHRSDDIVQAIKGLQRLRQKLRKRGKTATAQEIRSWINEGRP